MSTSKLYIGKEEILLSDLYETTIAKLIAGSFDKYQTKAVLQMLNDLDWIEPSIRYISNDARLMLYQTVLKEMKAGIYPVHTLGWSTLYFFFSEMGLNTAEMKTAINTSPILKREIKSSIIYSLIWN